MFVHIVENIFNEIVLVGRALNLHLVRTIQPVAAKLSFFKLRSRLTAAVDTSGRTSHNLYEIVFNLALFKLFDKPVRVSQTADDCDSDVLSRNFDVSFFNAV